MLTSNQIYIFFLIPLLTAFVHIFFVPILNKNKILLYLTITICIYSVIKYHYRFNEERKFNELQNVDLKKSIDAETIHPSLAGLKWITINFPENPKTENKLLLITSIKVMDEYFETKKKIEEKKKELNDLSNKFKELRSLVYQYRDNKEKEVEILKENQENFKEEIEKNKEVYEKMIDDAAEKIETFIQKASSDNQIQ